MFTHEYLEMKRYEGLSSNQKIYFGPSIPHTFISNMDSRTGPEMVATLQATGDDI